MSLCCPKSALLHALCRACLQHQRDAVDRPCGNETASLSDLLPEHQLKVLRASWQAKGPWVAGLLGDTTDTLFDNISNRLWSGALEGMAYQSNHCFSVQRGTREDLHAKCESLMQRGEAAVDDGWPCRRGRNALKILVWCPTGVS